MPNNRHGPILLKNSVTCWAWLHHLIFRWGLTGWVLRDVSSRVLWLTRGPPWADLSTSGPLVFRFWTMAAGQSSVLIL